LANKDRSNKKNETKRTNTPRGVGYTNDKNLSAADYVEQLDGETITSTLKPTRQISPNETILAV
jgi:hypothetical protein